MAHATPHASREHLIYHDGIEICTIAIGSPAWWYWLDAENTTTFRYENSQGSFTARREKKSGNWYWYAYRKSNGKLRKAYLGKADELLPERMDTVVAMLAEHERQELRSGSYIGGEREQVDHEQGDSRGRPGRTDASDSTPPDPILATKIYVPTARPDLVARPRLLERVNAGIRGKVMLISAPAGFGKTTLLSAWRATTQGSRMPVAWVSLDAGDNDPARFWNYIIAALQTIRAEIGELRAGGAQGVPLRIGEVPSMEPLLTLLINAITTIPRDFVLVLDDYHVIFMQFIHDALTFLLEYLPPQMHLVILSRNEPPLPLIRLRTQGQLSELQAADLRFTLDEVTAFLNTSMGLGLASDEIAGLDRHTEGWIAGLQLAALSMQGRQDNKSFIHRFNGSNRHVLEYLTAEVLSRQSRYIQDFLLYTSILDRLSDSLCLALVHAANDGGAGDAVGATLVVARPQEDAVTSSTGGQAMLEQLEQANLFLIPLDEQRQWYRYHHLFAEFLRARLRQLYPEVLPELHRRAAIWYEQHGLMTEAIEHALAAVDFQLAARLVEQSSEMMVKAGELMTLLKMLSMLPEEVVQREPRLAIYYAGALAGVGQLDAAEARLQDVERVLEARGDDGYNPHRVQGELASAYAFIVSSRGDVPGTIKYAQRALEFLPEENVFVRSLIVASLGQAYILSGDLAAASQVFRETRAISQVAKNMHALLLSVCLEAFIQAAQGHLHDAVEIYRQAFYIKVEGSAGHPQEASLHFQDAKMPLAGIQPVHTRLFPGASMAYTGIGSIFYEWNRLDEAVEHLRSGVELGKQWGFMLMLSEAYAFLAMALQARGDLTEAFEVLAEAEQIMRQHQVQPALDWVLTSRARLWIASGDIEAAAEWAHIATTSENDPASYLHEYEHLTLVRLRICQGSYSKAQRFLDRLLQLAESEGRVRSVVEMLALRAISLHAQGKTSEAITDLAHSLSLAESEGYIRTFIGEGRLMLNLLRQALTRDIQVDYIDRLLAEFDMSIRQVTPDKPTLDQSTLNGAISSLLSEREMNVLRRIAAGKSNQEIAQEFVIAISTIKTHVNNIYVKLGVHSRTQAIAQARELGIIA